MKRKAARAKIKTNMGNFSCLCEDFSMRMRAFFHSYAKISHTHGPFLPLQSPFPRPFSPLIPCIPCIPWLKIRPSKSALECQRKKV